ncbi:MAG: phenylalanine--tRNA ligase subunit beta [Ruminococcus sp.]|jgi:phenylalanyl-tRNA synthetase beta chain|nr:phenylalanine--tRNA ligase subunit beta [Ruminococcus sp.]
MLVSMNWINDFVDLRGENIPELIHRFTLSTAEVEDIYYKGAETKGVVVGKILTLENHPNSKKLHLLTVDQGGKVVNVVCGAPNVKVGMYVALATDGGMVSGNPINRVMLAGYESCGMCCSEAELGLSADNSGIWELPDGLTVGTDIKEIFPIDDIVFEVDNKSLTNRPDLWGHYGIAREFSALTGKPLKPLDMVNPADFAALPSLDIKSSDELMYRYTAVRAENINVKVSPEYIKIRLFYCDLRPINLLADLTNYLMLELGQPMHAFDLRKVESVEIKRFPEEFEFTTLDGQKRKITPEMLMITSNNIPSAIAGVMGGLDSEIADDTTSLLLESANFDGVSVRRTSTKIGLRTDASMRYEKALDPEMTLTAAARFMKLLLTIDPGAKITSNFTDLYLKKYPERTIAFTKTYVNRYTGIEISDERIVKTLTLLGFEVLGGNGEFTVKVPSWRGTKDVTIKADIIEEITRIYGYDNFAVATSKSPLYPVKLSALKADENALKDTLVKEFSLHEVHSYIWADSKKNKALGIENPQTVKIINAGTPEHDMLRNSMIPSLLYFISENKTYSEDFGIFEIGKAFTGKNEKGEIIERKRLGIVLYSRKISEEKLLMKARDITDRLLLTIKHSNAEYKLLSASENYIHPKNNNEIFADGIGIGNISIIHPRIKNIIDKKAAIVSVEIDCTTLAEIPEKNIVYKETPRFPGIDVDITIPVPADKTFREVESLIKLPDCDVLRSLAVTDIYGEGTKNITVRISFASYEKTLSGAEVKEYTDKIISNLKEAGMSVKLGTEKLQTE